MSADQAVDQAINQFIERVNYLHDSNFGDFKRKLDVALTRLWHSLGHNSKAVDQLLYDVKKKVVFSTGMDVEEARHLALDAAETIRAKLH